MDFNHKADNSNMFDFEVYPTLSGGIRLKSIFYDTYWTDVTQTPDGPWVLTRSPPSTNHGSQNMFHPTIRGGNRIVIRNSNNKFCKRYTDHGRVSNLAAVEDFPDIHSVMLIEEPVVSRTISRVTYRLDDARIYNERTTALISDTVVNRLGHEITSELNLTETVTNTTNWSRNVTLTLGVTTGGSAGIPFVADGKIEVSTEVANSWDWGATREESIQVGSVRTVNVPPMSRIRGTLMATRLSYDVPFSYTQRDVLMNGNVVVSQKNDGIFTGHNGYGYYFEVVPLPLD